ncbi:hypothetical protein Pelo_7490 [Pelomyxa schiedti]|nr:hypothetical protein Pelo_7490 [Pelomyxa schiedti]
MVTFGVSTALMTLTHDVRWWATRRGEFLHGSSLHYLIVEKGRGVFLLQDRQTGKRIQLVKFPGGDDSVRCATNGRWIACCDTHSMKLVVVEIPMRKNANGCGATTTTIERPTAVKIDPRWKICAPQFVGVINENHVLLCCHDDYLHPTFFEFVLVDLVETCSSKRLAVLSSTVPRLSDLPPSLGRFKSFVSKQYHVFRKQHREGGGGSTNHLLFVMREGEGLFPCSYHFITIEEGTGKLGRAFPESMREDLRVSQVSQSQFCVMDDDSDFPVTCYSVWDVNNTGSKPVRKQQCLSGCTTSQAFVEGGLLFQVGGGATRAAARKEIHVTDEATGVQVITLQLGHSGCRSLRSVRTNTTTTPFAQVLLQVLAVTVDPTNCLWI